MGFQRRLPQQRLVAHIGHPSLPPRRQGVPTFTMAPNPIQGRRPGVNYVGKPISGTPQPRALRRGECIQNPKADLEGAPH
jgi:hypothetical protein